MGFGLEAHGAPLVARCQGLTLLPPQTIARVPHKGSPAIGARPRARSSRGRLMVAKGVVSRFSSPGWRVSVCWSSSLVTDPWLLLTSNCVLCLRCRNGAGHSLCSMRRLRCWQRLRQLVCSHTGGRSTSSLSTGVCPWQLGPPRWRPPHGWRLGDFDEDGTVFLFPSVPMREPWLLYSVAKARVGLRKLGLFLVVAPPCLPRWRPPGWR